MSPDLDVAVVGAGPAGLAAAYALQRAGRSVHVFEAGEGVGGRMRTLRRDGYVIDTGAEIISTRGYPATWRLIRELGVPATDVPGMRNPLAVWRDGRAHPHVGRPLGLLTGGGLSPRGRLDLLRFNAAGARGSRELDPDHPERTPLGDMSVAQLAEGYRRELSDYLFQPLVSGFFGWEMDRSAAASLAATLAPTGATTNWRTYREGMDTLARRLAERLDVTTECRVQEVVSARDSARITASGAVLTARSVVLAVPAPAALDLHANAPEDERPYLQACTFVPRLKVSCALDRPITARGGRCVYVILVPAVENPVVSIITLDHHKPGRTPPGRGLVTLLTSPRATRELIDAPDDEVVGRVTVQGERFLPGLRQVTRASAVHRFHYGLPEATPAAVRLRAEFLRRPVRALDYAGDWLMLRPSSEAAIRSADLTTARIVAHTQEAVRRVTAGSRAGQADGHD